MADSGPRSGKNAPKKGKVRKATNAGGRERQKTVRAKPQPSLLALAHGLVVEVDNHGSSKTTRKKPRTG